MSNRSTLVVGAGPAGLTAAYELVNRGIRPTVLEKRDKVGGIARTEVYKGHRFDVGGHRFFSKVTEVRQLWQETLGDDLLTVPRLSRIYYRGRFFNYPLDLFNTLANLGIVESVLSGLSYLRAQLAPDPQDATLEQFMSNRFGQRLFHMFFQNYSEKVWGLPCDQILADWGAQRIKGLSLKAALANAVFGDNRIQTLISQFEYPVQGAGMMWERLCERVESFGGEVHLNAEVISFKREGSRVESVIAQCDNETIEFPADYFISSIPLDELIPGINTPPPLEVCQAASQLKHRAFILVGLIIDRNDLFPDNWVYVNSPEVKVGRIQNFGNWSAAMVPDPSKTSVGMEYFCTEGDEIWEMSGAELIELATRELAHLKLGDRADVEDGIVIRQPKAYPVYDFGYRERLQVIQRFLASISNLQTIGRSGMHRYNNMDHSMLTSMLAVRNLLGEEHDLWSVNTEHTYHEEDRNPGT